MIVYPLKQMTIKEAMQKQFSLVDEICKEFQGSQFLNLGDLGVVQPANKPNRTEKVENVLARLFNVERALLIVGAGTGAIRQGLEVILKPNQNVLVHNAAIYPTTLHSLKTMNVNIIKADFNNIENIKAVMDENRIDAAIIQYTRQQPQDHYIMGEVIKAIKACKDIPILTDDNYAVMKVDKIGVELGADISAFSAFKLLGPEGVGVVLGKKSYLDKIEKNNYSGGSKVQGWQAMEFIRMLTYAPVALAIQAEEINKIIEKINNLHIPEIKQAFIANAQSKVILIEFYEEIADEVLKAAQLLGAAPNPVGAESKYEIAPMFYRVSGTFREYDSSLENRMIRINPMRGGSETVLRILTESIKKVKECSLKK